jgi:hypothetical protein
VNKKEEKMNLSQGTVQKSNVDFSLFLRVLGLVTCFQMTAQEKGTVASLSRHLADTALSRSLRSPGCHVPLIWHLFLKRVFQFCGILARKT